MASPTPLSETELENRRLFIMEGRRKAWSFYRIADEVEKKFGYPISPMQCSVDYKVIMRKRATEMNEETDAHRAAMLDQIDGILAKHLELAENGDTDAADVCIKLFTRRARITGIDAPVKSERKDTSQRPRLTETQLMDKMREVMEKLGIRGAIRRKPEVINVTPAKLTQENITDNPAMIDQENFAEDPVLGEPSSPERRLDREHREDEQADED